MAANTEYTKIKESAISAFFTKLKAFFWKSADVVTYPLADVATTGSYNDLSDQPEIPVVPATSTIPEDGLRANVHYTLGTLTGTVAITLDSTSEVAGQMNIYSLTFTAGATAPTITWPSSITQWAGNCLDATTMAPVITGGNTYEVSIVDGQAVITEFVA